jgi:hypothetical protein
LLFYGMAFPSQPPYSPIFKERAQCRMALNSRKSLGSNEL